MPQVAALPPLLQRLNNYGCEGERNPVRGEDVGALIGDYHSLLELLPSAPTPAICEPLSLERIPLTHERLHKFIADFDLTEFGVPVGSRIAVLLANGPELAVTLMCVISGWCAAPINPTNTWQEIRAELKSTKSIAMIIMSGAATNDAALKAAEEVDIGVISITPQGDVTGLFRCHLVKPMKPESIVPCNKQLTPATAHSSYFISYGHPEIVLLLHTSGTSGNKKLVPFSLDMLIVGAGCIVASWNLKPSDVCLNMMPLFHVGGIVRNIISPLLSGGALIACGGFDPLLFWDILYDDAKQTRKPAEQVPKVTWYYAAPTMHHSILMEAERRPQPLPVQSVRYIANAAGGLLPVLAARLRDTFDATILTSYGMTECMPISTPPQSFKLNPIGTSGTPVGPDVLIVSDEQEAVPPGTKGNIFVRGPPCFGGYEDSGEANEESFFEVKNHGGGWFNTGDMGYVDQEGYLFISGRSKEVINRGGETISPFEIEEVIVQHPSVKEVIAFSAPHEQYQETVGAVIVTKANRPRVDLPGLHKYLDNKLHRSKWPQVIVYSDGLPKNATNKTLRIKYAERVGIKNVDEESSPLSRLFEAKCPPIGTPLTVAIESRPVVADLEKVHKLLRSISDVLQTAVVLVDLPSQQDCVVALVVVKSQDEDNGGDKASSSNGKAITITEMLKLACDEALDGYCAPRYIFSVSSLSADVAFDVNKLRKQAVELYERTNTIAPRNQVEKQIELIWRSMLGCPTVISVNSSFFDLGGDSLKAGQIIGAMRQQLRVTLTVADLFTAPTIASMAVKVSTSKILGSPQISNGKSGTKSLSPSHQSPLMRSEKRRSAAEKYQSKLGTIEEDRRESLHREYMTWDFSPRYSSSSFGCLFVQALPITVIYPIRRIAMWFLIAGIWVKFMKVGHGRFVALLLAMFLSRLIIGIGAPLVGILAKWLIIGRYEAGRYPLWGTMYLKWWFVEQIINISGKGFFRDDLPIIGTHMVRLYYILMGAKVGRNVKIHKDAKLGQADLLTIGDNVAVDNCTIRPFSLEEGYFVLLPISIGNNCSVGVKSVVAAGADIPDGTYIGPLSSSHEAELDADPAYRKYCRPLFAQPPIYLIIFIGIPLLLLVLAIGFLPWVIILRLMVSNAKIAGWYQPHIHSIYHAFLWWITPQRLFYFFLLRIIRRCVVPYFKLAAIILIKRLIVGKFTPMNAAEKARPWNRFRYWLMAKLLPGGGLVGVAKLVGTHYEIISMIYRMMGAKVGKRVYWPGSGLEIVEFDLLEVGDDVVFGSRSVIITSSTETSKKVVFESGTMIADRCVILPGARVRKGAVMGSGALAAEDMVIPVGSVWLGSQRGAALCVAPADYSYDTKDTASPFGLAFYEGKASFTVIPLWAIVLYNSLWQAFCTCYRNCPTALSLIICSYLMQFDPFEDHSPQELFKVTFLAFSPLFLTLSCIALGVDIGSKWLLLGRRQQGVYPWDQSSYCQRWQIYLTLQEIRRGERHKCGILDMIQGSQYLVWYFQALGSRIGNNVCLYPNGGDPMMTEPDLVTIGDFVGVDDASLVAHINTRGLFRLNPLVVRTGCVLKTASRLLSGASMESHSILLEHTLVLSGELVEVGSVWQGWPCRKQINLKSYRQDIIDLLNVVSRQRLHEMRSTVTYLNKYAESTAYPVKLDMGDVEEAKRSNSRSRTNLAKDDYAALSIQDLEKQPLLSTHHKNYC